MSGMDAMDSMGSPASPRSSESEKSEDKNSEQHPRGTVFDYHSTSRSVPLKEMNAWQAAVARVIRTSAFEMVMSAVILVSAACAVAEVEFGAEGEVPTWLHWSSRVFVVVFLAEILLSLFVDRAHFISDPINLVMIALVVLDIVDILYAALNLPSASTSVFRVFRVSRLLRLFRRYETFRELWLMLHGLASAMKAMFWASVLISIVLFIWSIVAVEILHPLGKEMDHECEACDTAFRSIEDSLFTWFLLIFVGEMWDDVAIPFMQSHPWTVGIFLMGYVTVNLGLLNLILTVIVDRAAEARLEDEHEKVEEKSIAFNAAKRKITEYCKDMDSDQSGTIDLQELQNGFDSTPGFADTLRVMDVARGELETVFNILDEDKSGSISYKEFVDQLYKMKTQGSQTLLIFIKHYITDVRLKVTEQLELIKTDLVQQAEQNTKMISALYSGDAGAIASPSGKAMFREMMSSVLRAEKECDHEESGDGVELFSSPRAARDLFAQSFEATHSV